MARIFVTGSSDGLGSLAAQTLVKKGHQVVLHARNAQRAKDATAACPEAEVVLVADLSSITETKKLAEEVNKLGGVDTVIHNAGLYRGGFEKTEDGLPSLFAVNTITPYILTCLIKKPKRLVYVSSGLHNGGDPTLKDMAWKERGEKGWSDGQGYADTKLHAIILSKAAARRWPDVSSNSLDPGWVATKMGGASATGDINAALETYTMLAEGDGKGKTSGKHFKSGKREASPKAASDDVATQEKLLKLCEEITGVQFPS
jgi:NAD(P)-dependent dehydrogenase (short-subunit alcohol dehydrogenase family)